MFWELAAKTYVLPHDKTNKMTVHPAKTQISLDIHPVWSVFAVRMKKAWVLSYPLSAQRRLWSDWADAQADLSLRWAHCHFVGFVMRRFICKWVYWYINVFLWLQQLISKNLKELRGTKLSHLFTDIFIFICHEKPYFQDILAKDSQYQYGKNVKI